MLLKNRRIKNSMLHASIIIKSDKNLICTSTGHSEPQDFDRSLNPFSTRRANHAYYIAIYLPDFQTFLRPCNKTILNFDCLACPCPFPGLLFYVGFSVKTTGAYFFKNDNLSNCLKAMKGCSI